MRIFFTVRKWKLRVGKQKLWVGKQKLRVAIYTVENGPFIKKSNLFFFFSKFTRIIAVLKWFPAVRWLFSRLLKLKSPLVSLVAFKLLEPGKQPTHSWKPFSHGKISKSVEKKKNKVLFISNKQKESGFSNRTVKNVCLCKRSSWTIKVWGCMNFLSQNLHQYGFSPVWIYWWLLRLWPNSQKTL